MPITLNAAFCERHRRDCPPSEELERECGRVRASVPAKGEGMCGVPTAALPLVLVAPVALRVPTAALSPAPPPMQAEALHRELHEAYAALEAPPDSYWQQLSDEAEAQRAAAEQPAGEHIEL